MANILHVADNHTVPELQAILKQSNDEGQKTPVRVILGIKKGRLRKEMAESLSLNIDTITNTVRRYNEQGIDGLKTNKGGRPEGNPTWDRNIFDDLAKAIDSQKKYWSIPLMMEWIKKTKGKEIPYSTVWYRVHSLNYSYKSSRPHPYLGNKDKQTSFKKGASRA